MNILNEEIVKMKTECPYKDVCPFYNYMNVMMTTFRQPVIYSPIDYDIIKSRKMDTTIQNIYDFEKMLYGRHYCEFKDIKIQALSQDVYNRCNLASDLTEKEPIYVLSYFNWFRSFFNLHIKPLIKNVKKKPKIKVVKSYKDIGQDYYAQYFKDFDIFNIFSEIVPVDIDLQLYDVKDMEYDYIREDHCFMKRNNSMIEMEEEYYQFLKDNFEEGQIYEMYKIFIMKNPLEIPLWANTYNDPCSFNYHMDRQYPQYVDVIRAIQTEGRLYIVGDGPGTASMAAWTLSKQYYSMEPNEIGDIAKKIGLINKDLQLGDKEEDILLLFNVIQYIPEGELKEYYSYRNIVIIDEAMLAEYNEVKCRKHGDRRRNDRMFRPHPQGGGKVFVKNVKMGPIMTFPLENTRYLFNRSGQLVTPQDYRSQVIVDLMGIKTGDGKLVCLEESEYMNVMTKNDPKDKRAKPTSSIKLVEGQYVKVYPGKNLLTLEDSRVKRYFHDYNSMRFTDNYIFHQDYYYVKTPVPHRLQYIKLRDNGKYINVYLIKKIVQGGVMYGVYRDYLNMMAVELSSVEIFNGSQANQEAQNYKDKN